MEIKPVTLALLEQFKDFIEEVDDEWLLRHIAIILFDNTKTIRIEIDNLNEQEYQWLKEAR